MTSKISCYKMTMNGVKRRIWYGAVLFLVFFLGFPLNAMLRFISKREIAASYTSPKDRTQALEMVQTQFVKFIGGGDYLLMSMVVGAALLGAWSALYWLHSKKKMDMIGSLPVRREKIFLSESIATFVLFFVPYFVNMIFAIIVGAAKGILTGKVFGALLAGCGIHLIYFAVLYLCAAIAMLLTGKLLTGILGTIVFLVIGPAFYLISQALPELFWETYVNSFDVKGNILTYLSPVGEFGVATAKMQQLLEKGEGFSSLLPLLAGAIVMGIIFAVIDVWLVKIRPAEGAENSMAFPKTEGAIKALILYPLGIGGGLFFMAIGDSTAGRSGKTWFWFGLIFALILGSIIIEVIYHFDRKMIFGHKGWTGACMGAVIVTSAIFSFDLFGYDTWLPDPANVANAAICTDKSYYEYPDGSENSIEYLENHLDELNGDGVLELAEKGVDYIKNPISDDVRTRTVTVLFKMKNGSVKKRNYSVDAENVADVEEKLYQNPIFREAMHPALLDGSDGVVMDYIWRLGQSFVLDGWSEKEKEELLDIYREELRSLDYDKIFAPGSGQVQMMTQDSERYIEGAYPLNKNFVKTTAFLEEKGNEAAKDLDQVEIVSMNFYWDSDDFEITDEKEITDAALIEKARKNLYNDDWGFNVKLSDEVHVVVTYLSKGEMFSCDCAYLKGKIPEAVKEIMNE